MCTSAATTPPSESFTTSPGTSSAACMVFHAPSRRTDAFSASRDFSAARVAWARLSWNRPSAALNTRRPAMIAASTYSPSASSSTTAASSIHGTGAQNFSTAMRNACTLVSGMALGPNFARRLRASSLVRPLGGASFAGSAELAGGADGGLHLSESSAPPGTSPDASFRPCWAPGSSWFTFTVAFRSNSSYGHSAAIVRRSGRCLRLRLQARVRRQASSGPRWAPEPAR